MVLRSLIFLALLGILSASESCPTSKLKNATSGFFTSPGFEYRDWYSSNLNCSWHIKSSDEAKVIKLTIWTFHLDGNGGDYCPGDILVIYDSFMADKQRTIGRFCGSLIPDVITSAGPDLFVNFVSDSYMAYKGFNISYNIIDPPVCKSGDLICKNNKCVGEEKMCDGQDDCGDGTDEEKCGSKITTRPKVCGIQETQPSIDQITGTNIVGGSAAVPGSWPWMVELRLLSLGGIADEEACGGTLINERFVVTAAHCFKIEQDISKWRIRIGAYHKYYPNKGEALRYIKKKNIHPEYTGYLPYDPKIVYNKRKNDIAILEMNAPVRMSKLIQPICLPEIFENYTNGDIQYAIGWGKTQGTGSDNVLKQTSIVTYPMKFCETIFKKYVWNKMICAGNMKSNTDTCQGDSGGPLMKKRNGKWEFTGITSFGPNPCAQMENPSLYTNVGFYVDWINMVVYNSTSN